MKRSIKSFLSNYQFLAFLLSFVAFFSFMYLKKNNYFQKETNTSKPIQLKFNEQILALSRVSDSSKKFKDFLATTDSSSFYAVTLIDGGCSICISTLLSWKKLVSQENISPKKIIFFGYDATFTQLEYLNKDIANSDFPIIIDSRYYFGTVNNITQNSDHKIMLIDKNWKVINSGNPFINKTTMQEYIRYANQGSKYVENFIG